MRIFLSAGEPSGDLHGANLIRVIHFARTHEQFFADVEVSRLLGGSWRAR